VDFILSMCYGGSGDVLSVKMMQAPLATERMRTRVGAIRTHTRAQASEPFWSKFLAATTGYSALVVGCWFGHWVF
jgi:NAD(P)H-hydrate repair Nnr-like enzyme with NAD(P)H-hydrate dehydratase domain